MGQLNLKALEDEKAGDDQGTVVPLKDRAGDPYLDSKGQPVTMTVLGAFAAPVRQAKAQNKRRWIKALRRGQDDSDPNDVALVNVCCAAVVGWSGVEDNGEPVKFTPENLRAVLMAGEWIVSQVTAVVENPRLFSTSSSES